MGVVEVAMIAWVILSFESHFTGVVTGVQTNVRVEAAWRDYDAAKEDMDKRQSWNPKVQYKIEQVEVR
jgi:hypothetical protein